MLWCERWESVLITLRCSALQLAPAWVVSFGGGAYERILVGHAPIRSARQAIELAGSCGAYMHRGGWSADSDTQLCHCLVRNGNGCGRASCWVACLCALCEIPRSSGRGWVGRSIGWVVQFDRSRQTSGRDASWLELASQSHLGVQPQQLLRCGGLQCCWFAPVEDGVNSHGQSGGESPWSGFCINVFTMS